MVLRQRKFTILSLVLVCWLAMAGSRQAAWATEVGIGGDGSGNLGASIIGGQPAASDQFKGYVHPGGSGVCGGQLVAPDIVLTAAHCESAFSMGTRLFIGALSLDGSDAKETRFVAQIFKHPDYFLSDDPYNFKLRNDIMLVKLSQRSYEPTVEWNVDSSIPIQGGSVKIVGFGRTNGNDPNSISRSLLTTTVSALDDSDCAAAFGSIFEPSQNFCYGSGTATTCNGDSGSPIFDDATGVILGLVSFGLVSCSDASVCTEVAAYADWIQTSVCALTDETLEEICGPPVCGDGMCNGEEDSSSCPADCPSTSCGDGLCNGSETASSCAEDCGSGFVEGCGDGVCRDSEDASTCLVDCGQGCQVFNEGNLQASQNHVLQLTVPVLAGQFIACKTSTTSRSDGDANLYMQFTYQKFLDASSVSPDSNEVCESSVAAMDADLVVQVYAHTAFTGLTLTCYMGPCTSNSRLSTPSPTTLPPYLRSTPPPNPQPTPPPNPQPTPPPNPQPTPPPNPQPTPPPNPQLTPPPNPQPTLPPNLRSTPPPNSQPTPPPNPQPTPPPNPSPTPPPNSTPKEGGGGSCFSKHTEIEVLGQGPTRMDALKIGDAVRISDGTFSTVFSFGHKDLTSKTSYLQVFAANMEQGHPLEISPEHLIYAQRNAVKNTVALVAAGSLQVGDSLLTKDGIPAEILWIGRIECQGAYSPLTGSGNLLVNGVLASSYVSRDWLKDYVSGGTLHTFQHGALLPVRIYCFIVNCQQESYDKTTGFSDWVQFWYRVEQWQLRLGTAPRVLFFLFFVLVAIPTILLGGLVALPVSSMVIHLVAACSGYCLWRQWNNKHKVCENRMLSKTTAIE